MVINQLVNGDWHLGILYFGSDGSAFAFIYEYDPDSEEQIKHSLFVAPETAFFKPEKQNTRPGILQGVPDKSRPVHIRAFGINGSLSPDPKFPVLFPALF